MKTDAHITIINDMMFETKLNNSDLYFQKIFPRKKLSQFIDYYWISRSGNPVEYSAKIIQDGSIYMLFLFDAEYKIKMNEDNFTRISNAYIVGGKKFNTFFSESGAVNVIGVRFKPGGFYPFMQIPSSEFSDSFLNLELLFGNKILELEEKLYETGNADDKIGEIESFLLSIIPDSTDDNDLIGLNISKIIAGHSHISINQLSNEAGLYYKKLERIFLKEVGFTPKYLSRVMRFQSLLSDIFKNRYRNISDLTYNNYYSDQSHLTKEFKFFTGYTPKEFLLNLNRERSRI